MFVQAAEPESSVSFAVDYIRGVVGYLLILLSVELCRYGKLSIAPADEFVVVTQSLCSVIFPIQPEVGIS